MFDFWGFFFMIYLIMFFFFVYMEDSGFCVEKESGFISNK